MTLTTEEKRAINVEYGDFEVIDKEKSRRFSKQGS